MTIHSSRTTMLWAGLACVAAAATAGVLLRGHVPPADAWILDHWSAGAETGLGRLAQVMSGLGTLTAVAVLAAMVVAVGRRRPVDKARLLARSGVVLLGCVAVLLSQAAFRRPGPPLVAQDWTYPSGHMVVATAAVFTAILLSRRLSPRWRAVATLGAIITIGSVGVSRLVLAEHYLLDLAGAVVATVGVGLVAAAALRLSPPTASVAGPVRPRVPRP